MTLDLSTVSSGRSDIRIVSGVPGCGKTTRTRAQIIAQPAIYVCAYPTAELLSEQADAFRQDAPYLRVFQAHSAYSKRPVARQIDDIAAIVTTDRLTHAVVLMTHASLMVVDLAAFSGAHLRIDEPLDSVKCGRIELSPDSLVLFANAFDLIPFGRSGWAEMNSKGSRPSWVAYAKDTLISGATDLFNAAKKAGRVLVNIDTWAGASGFDWCSIWMPTDLANFASVEIAGASYLRSLGGLVCQQWMADDVRFAEEDITARRTGQPSIRIHYFTMREAGKTEWGRLDGRKRLAQAAAFLTTNQPDLGYWSANSNARNLLDAYMPGELIPPKAVGLNRYRAHRSCALFYGSRVARGDHILIRDFQLTKEAIRCAREDEDVFQFALRGAVRDFGYAGDYEIYLYEQSQAVRLRDRLTCSGFTDVSIVSQIGFVSMSLVPSAPAKSPGLLVDPKAKRERKSQLQQLRRWQRAQAESRPPGRRGRPPKQSPPR